MATLDEIRLQQLLMPFNSGNQTGIATASNALPMINGSPFINTTDQLMKFDPNNLKNKSIVEQIIEENQMKANPFDPKNIQSIFPTNFQKNIRQAVPLSNLDLSSLPANMGVANEPDEEQVESLVNQPSGIAKLFEFLGNLPTPANILRNILPEQDPRAVGIKNFYRPYEGLTSTGSVASGIMKGYNPVSGGLLFKLTGGKFGKPTQYGLAGAMQRRIEKILGRKAPQTDASRAKIAELRNLQRAEMEDRFDRGESLSDIGKSTFSGKGMAFEKRSGGVSGKGTANERNYGGR
jgi:hypothetical protein